MFGTSPKIATPFCNSTVPRDPCRSEAERKVWFKAVRGSCARPLSKGCMALTATLGKFSGDHGVSKSLLPFGTAGLQPCMLAFGAFPLGSPYKNLWVEPWKKLDCCVACLSASNVFLPALVLGVMVANGGAAPKVTGHRNRKFPETKDYRLFISVSIAHTELKLDVSHATQRKERWY